MSAPFPIHKRKFHYAGNAWLVLKALAFHLFCNVEEKLLNELLSLV